MNVLMITPDWPTNETPYAGVFIKRQVDFLKQEGIDVTAFHINGKGKLINYIKASISVRKLAKSKKFNLVHAQWGHSAFLGMCTGLPMIITYRGSDLMGIFKNDKLTFAGRFIIFFSKTIAHRARCLIFVSKGLADKISINKPKFIIPSGLALSKIPLRNKNLLRKELLLPLDKKIIIFPNNPERKVKRYQLFEDTIKKLNRDDVIAHVVHGLEHEQLLKHLMASDFLLFTSKSEGSPNIIKEALACNLPIISVDVGDVKERVSAINGCFVVEEDTPQTLAEVLSKALDYDYNGYNSRQFLEDLDEGLLIKKLIEVYNTYF